MKKTLISAMLLCAALPLAADSPEEAQELHTKGREFLNANDIAKGREYTLKAAEMRERLFGKLSKEYVTSLNNYALSYLISGEPQKALEYQTEVVELCRQMDPPHPDEGMYLINLGRIHHALDNDDEAIRLMEEALTKVEKFSDNYQYILDFLGMVYLDRDDNDNVNRILTLAEEYNEDYLKRDCDDPECHLEKAEYLATTGRTALAKDEYMAVFALPLSDDEKVLAYRKYAVFLFEQKDFPQAAEYYRMASEASEGAAGVSEESVGLLRQAAICYFIGSDFDKSLEAHTAVIAAVDSNGFSEKLKGSSLQGLGNAYSGMRDHPKAIGAFRSWIAHLEANGHTDEPEYAKAYERLASEEKFNGDYDASLAEYDTAIDLYDRLGMYDERQQAADGKKRCLFYAHREMTETEEDDAAMHQRDEKTRRILQESLNTLEQSGGYLGKLSNAQTLATVAGCYAQLKDYDNAVKYYSMYVPALREAIAEDFLLKSPKERQLTWRHEMGNISEMNELIPSLTPGTEQYALLSGLVYEGQLLSKGILLSSAVEFDKVLDRYGTPEMKDKYGAIKSNLERIENMKEEHRPLAEILELSRKTDALQLSLARESAEYADYMGYLRVAASDVLGALADDEASVEFIILDTDVLSDRDMVAAAVLSKEYPSGLVVPVMTVGDLKAIMAADDRFSNDAYGDAVWGRILKVLGDKKKIYFAPDGLINNIGIEYLSVNGLPLSERIEVSRLSSTREVARDHRKAPLQYASLFGDIDYFTEGTEATDKSRYSGGKRGGGDFRFIPLDNTRREVDEIRSILKQHTKETFEYTGEEASKEEFLSQDRIYPLGLLHIATHGSYVDDSGAAETEAMDNSILAFAGANINPDLKANDGVVSAAEIAGMSLHDCGLVVLSACESGLGKLGADGVFGLQRGFKNAGVQSLLVSLKQVSDDSTADMMIAFYRNLFSGDGVSKREALRKAQAEIRSRYPADDTWSSFILIDSFD